MDKRCEHFLFRKLSRLPTPATILTCVIQTQPALKSGSRRSAAMRCRSIGYSGRLGRSWQSLVLISCSFSRNASSRLSLQETDVEQRKKTCFRRLVQDSWGRLFDTSSIYVAGIFLGTSQLAYRRQKLGRSPSPAKGVRVHAPPGNFWNIRCHYMHFREFWGT